MDDLEFNVMSTLGGPVVHVSAPANTKKGDRLGDLVVLCRSNLGRKPVLVVGPPKVGGDF